MKFGDDFGRFDDAAVQAELATGDAEETVEQARAHVVVRLARMAAGFMVLLLGIALLPLPGPGGIVVAAGLVILSRDVAWADRALRWLRKRTPGIPEDGRVPTSTIIVSLMLMTAAILAFYWLRSNFDLPIIG